MVRVKTPSGWKTVPSGTDVSVYGEEVLHLADIKQGRLALLLYII